jgi:membrane protein DedA with SNARE-associated domain
MFDVQSWLSSGGLFLLATITFAETGLLIGFLLPGDTLLVVAGFLTSAAGGHVLPPLPITAGVVFVAAALGDQVGYMFGRRLGPSVFNRPHSRLFNPANARRAETFFAQRGPSASILARFVPVVRTFTPIVADVVGRRDAGTSVEAPGRARPSRHLTGSGTCRRGTCHRVPGRARRTARSSGGWRASTSRWRR